MEDKSTPQKELSYVKLIRGQRGSYGWEIKIVDDDYKKILEKVEHLDEELTETYTNLNLKEVKKNANN